MWLYLLNRLNLQLHPPLCIMYLLSFSNRSQLGLNVSPLCPLIPSHPFRLQLRKDASSRSAAQTEGSPVASSPADPPCLLPEGSPEEVEGGGPAGKVDGEAEQEAPSGASVAQEAGAKQDAVCG